MLEGLPPDFGGEWGGQKKTEEKSDAATPGPACEAAMQTSELSFWNLHLKDVAPFLSCSAIKLLPGRDVNGAAILYLKSVDELFCSIRQHPVGNSTHLAYFPASPSSPAVAPRPPQVL